MLLQKKITKIVAFYVRHCRALIYFYSNILIWREQRTHYNLRIYPACALMRMPSHDNMARLYLPTLYIWKKLYTRSVYECILFCHVFCFIEIIFLYTYIYTKYPQIYKRIFFHIKSLSGTRIFYRKDFRWVFRCEPFIYRICI